MPASKANGLRTWVFIATRLKGPLASFYFNVVFTIVGQCLALENVSYQRLSLARFCAVHWSDLVLEQ